MLAPFLGNHDTMRPGSFMPGQDNVKMAAGVMAMMNGGIFVYYGEVQTLADLANSSNSAYLKKAEIYLFTVDDAYVQVEKSVRNRLQLDLGFEDQELPTFVPILGYRNLISNLLVDIPLYEPLVGKPKNSNKSLQ